MPGRFEGLSDNAWLVLERLLPPLPEKRGRGMPPASFRKTLNTIFYVLITSCRWCDVPEGKQWGHRSSAHRWLARWQKDGTWEKMTQGLLGCAQLCGMLNFSQGAIDGSFSPGAGRRRRRGLRL